jgi:hypothetical protein
MTRKALAILKVSKTDAAKRQLEAAIRLWFFDGDPVSIHTLAAAAHQLVHDLGKARGIATTLRELSNVRPEFRKQMRAAIAHDENFFKHAERDPDALLEFKPITTTYMLGDAVFTYEALTSERPPILRTFQMWMMIQNPDLVKEEFRGHWLAQLKGIAPVLERTSKQEFFSLYQSLIGKNESA